MKPAKITKARAQQIIAGDRRISLSYGDVSDRNLESSSSFDYDPFSTGLKNTQQLNVDWSDFSKHTFFNSAVSKVNVSFDKIIQEYPFDGTRANVESFFESLTGFERYVFNLFPKHSGSFFASGSYVSVQDSAGSSYPSLSKQPTGLSVLDMGSRSFTIEMHLNPSSSMNLAPTGSGVASCIMNRYDSSSKTGYAVYFDRSVSDASYGRLKFAVVSGSSFVSSSATIPYGEWSQLTMVLNRISETDAIASCYVGGELQSSSSIAKLGPLVGGDALLYIGSGSSHPVSVGDTVGPSVALYGLIGSVDELRLWSSVRTTEQIAMYANRSVFVDDDLLLCYRFNEPSPPLTSNSTDSVNSIVIDHSGHGLHGAITGFAADGSSRGDASELMYAEQSDMSPVLFPAYPELVALNVDMLASGTFYDSVNPNIITRLVPPHYFEEASIAQGFSDELGDVGTPYSSVGSSGPREGKKGSAALMLTFLLTYAKFFDELKLFIDAFSNVHHVDYDPIDTVPDGFLYGLLRKWGFDIAPNFADASLEQYVEGQNVSLDRYSRSSSSLRNVQSQLLRRVLINLPDIIRSKGTQHSVRSFLRCVGIDPDNSVRIRETGGPTERTLGTGRERKTNISHAVTFTSSSFLRTPHLSASSGRREVGFPYMTSSVSFVKNQAFPPHGLVSPTASGFDATSTAWVTSGSWTYEADYRFRPTVTRTSVSQSLMRMHVSANGTPYDGITDHCILNLVAISSSFEGSASVNFACATKLPLLPPDSSYISPIMSGTILADVFDGGWWRISLSRVRNDDPDIGCAGSLSSSYVIRAAKRDELGNIASIASGSFYFNDSFAVTFSALGTTELLANVMQFPEEQESTSNSAPMLVIGSGSIPYALSAAYLNESSAQSTYASANFLEADVHAVRFYSGFVSDEEFREHARNPFSQGSSIPSKNWNYSRAQSGSFERLRLEALIRPADVGTVGVSSTGVTFYDTSENGFHMSGSGFLTGSVRPILVGYSFLSPYIDEAVTDDKVRIRSFINDENLVDSPWASPAPVNELLRSERPVDDSRFSVDFSLADAVNRDIVKMFGTMDELQSAIGSPELVGSPDYPLLIALSDEYFNRVKADLNFKAFFEFYRWFDRSVGGFIEQLIPRKTRFKGTNFVVESHALERSKLQYHSMGIYLGGDVPRFIQSAPVIVGVGNTS